MINDIDKEKVIKKFQNEIQNKLLNKSFDIADDYTIKVSNIIAEAFVLYVFGIYKGQYNGFDIKPIKVNNNILLQIQTINEIQLADVLLSVSKTDGKLTITNILSNIKNI